MKSCLTSISEKYDALSYSEKLFADYIICNRDNAVRLSIADLSEHIGIAQSTIVATTKKLGFEGWKDFKISLAAELVNPLDKWEKVLKETSDASIAQQVISSDISCLQEIIRTVDSALFSAVSECLLNAKNIYIFGIGTSNILGQEAHDYFLRLGLSVTVYSNWHHQQLCVSQMSKDDLALFISQSGVNKDIISLAKQVQERGCTTVGISNFRNTPFSKYLDYMIASLASPSNKHDNHFALRLPIIAVIEILYYTIADKMGYEYQRELAHSFKIIKNASV